MQRLTEGKVSFFAPVSKVVSKELPVFYNPVMSLNRDISVVLLQALKRKNLVVADPLAGTGIRAIRFLKELPSSAIKELRVNDGNPAFPALLKKQLKLNKLSKKKVVIKREEATRFLLDGPGLDYIDIDPFGSPNPFLDAACKKLARDGILALTATDTGALAGSFPDACRRKYWAEPLRNELMHEVGLRILIRKAQLVAMQYERALVPIFSHATDHYDRVYLHAEKSKSYVKNILEQHGYLLYCPACMNRATSRMNRSLCDCGMSMHTAGPMWLGPLWNHALVGKMLMKASGTAEKLITVIHKEAHIPIVGFVDIHKVCKMLKITVPKSEAVINALKERGYHATPTQFSRTGIRTDAPFDVVSKIVRLQSRKA
jgi:tRNA (guanine26-N2/guanine27-N2)-dimethyltransferase